MVDAFVTPQMPDDLIERFLRHGISPNAGMYELMSEIHQHGWAFQLWGAPWRESSTRFTCQLYHRVADANGKERARHLLNRPESFTPWEAEEATPWGALARALVTALDVLSEEDDEK